MQYNFKILTSLSEAELKEIAATTEGLEVSGDLVIQAKLRVNTELPDEKVELLKETLDSLVEERFGPSEVTLVSTEH